MISSSGSPKKNRQTTAPLAVAALPVELLAIEVFMRFPVKSLMCFKSVCRSWRAAIEDPVFVRLHLARTRATKPPSLLAIPREDNLPDEPSECGDVSFHRLVLNEAREPDATARVELMFEKAWSEGETMTNALVPTHCDGLVALATATGRIFVCNPATREFVALPLGNPDVRETNTNTPPAAAIGYDAWRGRYVVARYFYREYEECRDEVTGKRWMEYDMGHEVYTLGGGGGDWIETDEPPHAIGPATPFSTRDSIYWCTAERFGVNALLRFSLRHRTFDVVACPPRACFAYGGYNVTALPGDKLCYVDTLKEPNFHVWVADDGPQQPEWVLRYRVNFSFFEPGVGEDALLPVAADGDEILMAADRKQLYRYDARHESVALVVDMEDELEYARADNSKPPYSEYLVHHVVPYVESLVPISGARTRLRNAPLVIG